MDIETAFQQVQSDDADVIATEAGYWKKMAAALRDQAGELRSAIKDVDGGIDSDSGRAFMEELKLRFARIDEAADVAETNSGAWNDIAAQVRANRNSIEGIHSEWKKAEKRLKASGGDVEAARRTFDDSARAQINVSARNISEYSATMRPPREYTPMPDLGGDSAVDSVGGAPGGTGPGASPPGGGPGGSSPGGAGPGGSSPRPDTGGDGPQLQTPPPSTAPPQPAPTPAPAPPPGGGPPPLPPPGTRPPLPPGGGKPALPPSAKPMPLPARPGTTPPATGPRPPQSTVRPVIGSRPGTTGMAPTGTGPRPGTTGVNRPVIGARPGPAAPPGGPPGSRSVPAKALIGGDGVVGDPRRTPQGVRVPKAHFGGTGTNRSVISGVRQAFKTGSGAPAPGKGGRGPEEAESRHHHEGGDHRWTVDREIVPGVISGGDWTGREHTPGNVADMRAEKQPVDESATVARLSRRPANEPESTKVDDFWALPPGGRGVVARQRARRHDANDW